MVLCALSAFVVNIFTQTETPPAPSAAKVATVPAVVEKKLANGLTVAVVEHKSSPLVTMAAVDQERRFVRVSGQGWPGGPNRFDVNQGNQNKISNADR